MTAAALAFGATAASAADLADPAAPAAPAPFSFSVTEIQFQLGKLDNPFNDTKSWTPIVTLQHASSWVFGDVFFFVDYLDDRRTDVSNFNDKEFYGEFYAYFSSAKLLGMQYGGPIKDVGVVAGVNAGADSNYLGYLPGVYVDWKVPGFVHFRTQFTAVIDNSDAPSEQKDGWQADWSFVAPFELAGQFFSFEGHVEYTANSRNKTFGTKQSDWILGQPQLRWDAGYAFTGKKDVFFLGTEYQFWINKLGVKDVDESAFQALAVVRF
ncbi:hypothetical protein ACFSCV_13980 [Methylopila henanensis]|uniref:Nucleoside-binding protein n=1 Tax=Methylopila henanensis TaxID=873516 RepID=A0ABW4KA41_9HYPH